MKPLSLTAFLLAGGALAQPPVPPPTPPAPGNGQRMYWATGIAGGTTVKNAPYTADAVTETTQTLGDGNRIVQRTTQKLYRDSDGRERREESLLADLIQPGGLRVITISDPVANTAYNLDPRIHVAQTIPMLGLYRNGAIAALVDGARVSVGRGRGAGSAQSLREDLGTKNIEGVNAQGTRMTETIAAGQIGNQFPIKIVDEAWYSPELQMNVLTTHNDPRTGEIVYKLTNLSRANPARSLFEVPSDYTIQTGPIGGGRSGGRGGGRGAPGNPAGGGRGLTPQK